MPSRTLPVPTALPVIDFSSFHSGSDAEKQQLAEEIKAACLKNGFFQIKNHGVSAEVRDTVMAQSKTFFAMPLQDKMDIHMEKSSTRIRGYEPLRYQNFEKKHKGDLKEGFQVGIDLPLDHPSSVAKKFGHGPNQWPETMSDPSAFKAAVESYFNEMYRLVKDILQVIATGLDLPSDWFDTFATSPVVTLKLLHYPPQEATTYEDERGIGAHTDFGAVTILVQDDVGGLQVFDRATEAWIDVTPIPGAFVVNLGNLMMRWSNDRYLSNLHRVINKSGVERYSMPFFFSGNPDFVVECLPGCAEPGEAPKWEPISVEEWMRGRYASTYGDKDSTARADPVAGT